MLRPACEPVNDNPPDIMKPFSVSAHSFSPVFWDGIFAETDAQARELEKLAADINALDRLRAQAEYNTGSISLAAATSLYALTRYFDFQRVIEIGTFIGKSTWSIASGMDAMRKDGQIFTCDLSNAISIPWTGKTKITQHKKTASLDMLKSLQGLFDFCFIDGRLTDEELPLLDRLITPQTIVALDDFEGMEKGVANIFKLRGLAKLGQHYLIYPPETGLLKGYGFSGRSCIAVMLPVSRITLTNQ